MEPEFNCWNCSACCRFCDKIDELKSFDRGDGTCIHLTEQNLCGIYDNRPEVCNTRKMFEKKWINYFSWEDYLIFSEKACKILENGMKKIKE